MIHIYGHFNRAFILILGFFSVSFSLCCSFVVCFPFDYALFFFVTLVCASKVPCVSRMWAPSYIYSLHLAVIWVKPIPGSEKKASPAFSYSPVPQFMLLMSSFTSSSFCCSLQLPSLSQRHFLFFFSLTYYWSDFLSSCDFSLSYLFLLVFYLEKTFNICFRMDLVLLNSFTFCLSEKFWVSPSILNVILLGRVS